MMRVPWGSLFIFVVVRRDNPYAVSDLVHFGIRTRLSNKNEAFSNKCLFGQELNLTAIVIKKIR